MLSGRSGRYSAPVQVFGPCQCQTCELGAKWFMCMRLDERHIATFDCAPYAGASSVPHPIAVVEIERMYPGTQLVYVDPVSKFFAKELEEQRARRPIERSMSETHPIDPVHVATRIFMRAMHQH